MLRRTLVRAALSGVVLGCATTPAPAQQKMSQAAAEYQDRPKNGLTCAASSLFRKPRSCEIVKGDITPAGWCKFLICPIDDHGQYLCEFRFMRNLVDDNDDTGSAGLAKAHSLNN